MSLPQLQMVWPMERLKSPPSVNLPSEYLIRPYQRGDKAAFCDLMELAGFGVWNEIRFTPWEDFFNVDLSRSKIIY